MKLLVTAFEPFSGGKLNSAQEALRDVPETVNGAQIVKLCLPVVFGRSMEMLRDAIRKEKPDTVLCLGQAEGRKALTPERIAINLKDARIPDNAGQQPVDEQVFPDGPDAYFSTLPVKSMAAAIRRADLPAEVSNSAGTYVCNQLMYGLMYYISHEFPTVRGGFLHIPCLKEQTEGQTDEEGFSARDLTRGVMAAIEALLSEEKPEAL